MSDSTIDAAALAKMPKPERSKKLLKSGLVRNYQEGDDTIGLFVYNGRIRGNDLLGKMAQPFPRELLANDSPIAREAQEILLSENRIVLDGNLQKAQNWLEEQGDAVELIRSLDIRFHDDVMSHWSEHAADWSGLMAFIAVNLRIEQLELCFDAGRSFEQYQKLDVTEESLSEVREIYEDIIETAHDMLEERKLKSFSVYWAAFHDSEAEDEKKIMGSDYDSLKLGKIPSSKRNPWFPHGAPEGLDWKNGMQLDS